MSEANKVIKNTGFLYAKMGITVFFSLFTTRLVLSALGTKDFGVYNIVGGAISMLGFLNVAMAGSTQRFMSFIEGEGDLNKKKQIFNISFIIHVVISLCFCLILILVGVYLFNGILNIEQGRVAAAKVVYFTLILSSVLTVMAVPFDAVLNSHENMLYYSFVGVLEAILKLAIAVWVSKTNYTDRLVLYSILMTGIPLVTLIIMQIYCYKNYNECNLAPRKYWDSSLAKEMAKFAGWNLIGSASSLIVGHGSGIVLNHFFGTAINAANGITGQVNGQLLAFSNTMQKALGPMITKTEGRGDRDLLIKSILIGSKYSFLMYAFFAIPILLETPMILDIWIEQIPDWTVTFIRISIFRVLIEQLTSSFSVAIAAIGKIKKISILNSIVNYCELVFLIISFSMGSSPLAFVVIGVISAFVSRSIQIYYTMTLISLSFNDFVQQLLLRVGLVFTGSLISGGLIVFLIEKSFLRIILTTSSVAICFLLLTYFVGASTIEKNYIISLASSRYNVIKDKINKLLKK